MSYKYDPITRMLVKTKDEDRSKLNSVLLKDMRKPKEYNPLDYRTRLQKLGYRPEVINKEMRSYSDGTKYADLKETRDSKTVDSKVYSVGYESNGVYQSIGVRADSPEEAMRKASDHFNAKGKKVKLLGASIGESENTMRMKGKPIIDKKTIDFSSSDAKSVFSYIDRKALKDRKDWEKIIDKAKSSDELGKVESQIRSNMDDILDEYLQIWNQVGSYAQDRKGIVMSEFTDLLSKAFKRYNELKKEGK